MRILFIAFLLNILTLSIHAQTMEISGNVQDTTLHTPVRFAVAMAINLKDSTLAGFSRTNQDGLFKIIALPVDTYEVIVSHHSFGDKIFIVTGSKTSSMFDFGKIILPPKNVDLKEVVVYAFKDPIYFNGDTLVYVADSFKVKPNATVEDLLKKLPGIRVDEQGKITSQGQAVDQVLVDGDEFFGTDPTIATRNLGAKTVESVQIYDKKNTDVSGGSEKETLKIMDLKLKENAKKGYFGKISMGSDFTKFHEGEVLLNKFNGKQKISLYGLGSNTPRNAFNWQDANKFGLNNETGYGESEDGTYYSRQENYSDGIPLTYKTGFYYRDNVLTKTKLMVNYNYKSNEVKTKSESTTQYFFTDSSYTTKNFDENVQKNESHQLIIAITQPLDSLTDLEIKPKITLGNSNSSNTGFAEFFNSENLPLRSSLVTNKNSSDVQNLENKTTLFRRFKKRERIFSIAHWVKYDENNSEGLLQSKNSMDSDLGTHQQKNKTGINQSQNVIVSYFEPISKKTKLGFTYNYIFSLGDLDSKSMDIDSTGILTENPYYTNTFENRKQTHLPGMRYIYELKKYRFEAGLNYRLLSEKNINASTGNEISQSLNSFLPFVNYRYKFSDNSSLSMRYYTVARQPGISQLQPVPDNTNPNQVREGNQNLKPMYMQSGGINFYSFKPISKRNIFGGINFTSTSGAFSNSTYFDSLGRTISTPINVNGNYNGNANLSARFPVIKNLLSANPGLNFSYNNSNSLINGKLNNTRESVSGAHIELELTWEPITLSAGADLSYNNPHSSLSLESNLPYASQSYNAFFMLDLPKAFQFSSDIDYHENSRRADGHNINYIIWNTSLSKNFLKTENLIVSINAFDLLNQNINTNRIITANQITDTKKDMLKRYVLVRLTYKFNNNKTKEQDEF